MSQHSKVGLRLCCDAAPSISAATNAPECADCYVPEMLAADGEGPIPAAAVPLLLSPFTRLLAEMRQPAGINRAM